jgi:hypothetical protein
MYKGALTPLEP